MQAVISCVNLRRQRQKGTTQTLAYFAEPSQKHNKSDDERLFNYFELEDQQANVVSTTAAAIAPFPKRAAGDGGVGGGGSCWSALSHQSAQQQDPQHGESWRSADCACSLQRGIHAGILCVKQTIKTSPSWSSHSIREIILGGGGGGGGKGGHF